MGGVEMKKNDLRSFGLIWAAIFAVVGLAPLFKAHDMRVWSILLSLLFVVIAFFKPEILKQFYTVWTKVGEFIGGIISKIMLFGLFYLIFTPIAVILRLFGKDLLNKKFSKEQSSYWVEREKQPESMKNQF